jgi:hypothetical protein
MQVRRRSVLKILSASAAALATSGLRAFAHGSPVIERDVCILGGGSTGTFSALHLRDAGKTVVVLERKQRLGGHAETFRDPATGGTIDYGVILLHDLPVVRDYFARLGVPLVPAVAGGGSTATFDFRTGAPFTGAPATPAEVQQALGAYFAILQQLKATYYDLDSGFDLPLPVPPDLLLPFGDFVVKFGLQAMVNTAFQFGQGIGDLLRMPTVYVMKLASAQLLTSVFANSFVHPPDGIAELYDRAADQLGNDVLFDAAVERVDRHRGGVTLHVRSGHARCEIRCKKLLVTVPPTLDNLRVLDLDALESATFARFRPNFYWAIVARLSGVPAGVSLANAGADTLYHLPPLPGIYGASATQVPGVWDIKYGSTRWLSDAEVKRRVVADIQRLHDPATFSTPPRVEEILVFAAHTPFELHVTAEDIAAGFYTTLGSLQGRNHTFYNGAAFDTHDSSLLWQFTRNHVLPLVLA